MSILSEIMTANEYFTTHLPKSYSEKKENNEKLPKRHMAIVTCMDTRLVEFLEPALGVSRGEAKIIKNAGNTVTGTFEATIRSLVVSIFELGVKEIFVIGHHDCGVANTNSKELIQKMLERGIAKEAIQMIQSELERWIDDFQDPLQNIQTVVAKIKTNPLIPKDIAIHGLIFDPKTGKVDIVVDGYESIDK
ncbi:beta-class carbonic anhydrase [Anaerosinus gibii]|uniref:carbonic anhydrase n=1 Tax=Selenobaculum gibii TaxID=3054208 RepID=A0A9Y2AHG0_9FIRM|nr:carbonic anhydrase [Selenobaculum gbiensis]WIW70154.1 carbonic anhydrase [Selenobaculum gbiensis]